MITCIIQLGAHLVEAESSGSAIPDPTRAMSSILYVVFLCVCMCVYMYVCARVPMFDSTSTP